MGAAAISFFQGDAERRATMSVPVDGLVGRVVAVEHEGRVRRVGRADRWLRGRCHRARNCHAALGVLRRTLR